MTERTNHRAGRQPRARARLSGAFTRPDHRAVQALHSAVAGRTLSANSSRHNRRIHGCNRCAGWRFISKAARP
jgi:hypothetical protein